MTNLKPVYRKTSKEAVEAINILLLYNPGVENGNIYQPISNRLNIYARLFIQQIM